MSYINGGVDEVFEKFIGRICVGNFVSKSYSLIKIMVFFIIFFHLSLIFSIVIIQNLT